MDFKPVLQKMLDIKAYGYEFLSYEKNKFN